MSETQAQAQVEESAAPRSVNPADEEIPPDVLRMQEAARRLSRKLGRPLRTQIPDPLSDADWEELILARMLNYDKRISGDELMAEVARLRRQILNNSR